MKILVAQDFLRSGGTERQSVLLANAFAAAGHTVTLLTFRPGGALQSTVSERVSLQALQPFDTGLDWFAPGLSGAVRRPAPDVVLLMGRMANCAGGWIARAVGHRAAVVGTMRTGKKLPWLFRASLRRIRHVVANSHDARDTLVRVHSTPAKNVSVIHNSLVFPAERPAEADLTARDAFRARHGASPSTKVLLCVAMFRPEKNQRELIEILAGLRADSPWQLWLAGDGPDRSGCEALASDRGIASRVKFFGFLADPSALYAAADIAVHASWSEALSNFLIEAQSHGLPAVAYEAQGIRECFVPNDTGWAIARNDQAAFRAALIRLLDEPAEATRRRAAAARAYARTTFDPARQVAAYLDLFHSLVGPPAP